MGSRISKLRNFSHQTQSPQSDEPPKYESIGIIRGEWGAASWNSNENEIPGMGAYDPPQWKWNNAQCRTWVAAVLVVHLGKSQEEAHKLAGKFRGCGPGLWTKSRYEWAQWLGYDEGLSVSDMMLGHYVRRKKTGAIPKAVMIPQWKRKS